MAAPQGKNPHPNPLPEYGARGMAVEPIVRCAPSSLATCDNIGKGIFWPQNSGSLCDRDGRGPIGRWGVCSCAPR